MERFGFFEEPFYHAPLEAEVFQFLECTFLVQCRIVRKLSAFDEIEDNSIFQAGQDPSDGV